MTLDEAKRLFAQYIDYDAETPNYYDMEEACKMAIKALEQEQMRDATPEERESVNAYIKSISKPTGVKFGALK